MKQNNFRKRPETKRKHKINQELNFTEVRIVGRGEPFVISTKEALDIAFSEEKDLILINENQNPPIVRIEDYNKFLYNAEKAEKEKKRNSNKSQLKEIQLSVNISDHDLETKAKKGREFLNDGDKVKVVISLKGRQKANPARGELVMLKFAQLVEEFGIPESMPKLESGKWLMMMKTKKKG
jgi:translation initiation factor IF-3